VRLIAAQFVKPFGIAIGLWADRLVLVRAETSSARWFLGGLVAHQSDFPGVGSAATACRKFHGLSLVRSTRKIRPLCKYRQAIRFDSTNSF